MYWWQFQIMAMFQQSGLPGLSLQSSQATNVESDNAGGHQPTLPPNSTTDRSGHQLPNRRGHQLQQPRGDQPPHARGDHHSQLRRDQPPLTSARGGHQPLRGSNQTPRSIRGGHRPTVSRGEQQPPRRIPSRPTHDSRQSMPESPQLQPGDVQATLMTLRRDVDRILTGQAQHGAKLDMLVTAMAEMKDLQSQFAKSSYTLKGANLEKPVREEVAKIFCKSLNRYPDNSIVREAILKVLPRQDRQKRHVSETALKEANSFLSTFRTEERRRVLGLKPQEAACTLSTEALASNFMEYIKAPHEDRELRNNYIKHLAMLRKFVREIHEDPITVKQFHQHFSKWVADCYPTGVSDEEWEQIMDEDSTHPYTTHPTSNPPPPESLQPLSANRDDSTLEGILEHEQDNPSSFGLDQPEFNLPSHDGMYHFSPATHDDHYSYSPLDLIPV